MSTQEYLSYAEEQQAIADAIAKFPERFGLRAFPGKVFAISRAHSYYSPSEGVMLYTIVHNGGDDWSAWCKGTVAELQRNIVNL